jgi:hypothetical protein
MAWREVHDQILEEHRVLGAMLDAIGGLLDRFEQGDPDSVDPLRDQARALYLRFEAHLSFEDRAPLPVLRDGRLNTGADTLVREHVDGAGCSTSSSTSVALPGRPAMLAGARAAAVRTPAARGSRAEERLPAGQAAGASSRA